jgi:hypothetical protein
LDAVHRILQHNGEVASPGGMVDAKDADAVSFTKGMVFLDYRMLKDGYFF